MLDNRSTLNKSKANQEVEIDEKVILYKGGQKRSSFS